jgi:hypothetical protein
MLVSINSCKNSENKLYLVLFKNLLTIYTELEYYELFNLFLYHLENENELQLKRFKLGKYRWQMVSRRAP